MPELHNYLNFSGNIILTLPKAKASIINLNSEAKLKALKSCQNKFIFTATHFVSKNKDCLFLYDWKDPSGKKVFWGSPRSVWDEGFLGVPNTFN